MAPAPPNKAAKPGRRPLGLSPATWALIVGGGLSVVYIYERRRAAASASASTGSTAGDTIPSSGLTGGSVTDEGTGTSAPNTLAEWIQSGISSSTGANYSGAQVLNDLNQWLAGGCVSSAGATAIPNLVETLGLPPGFSTVPTLSVCPDAPTYAPSGGDEAPTNTAAFGPQTTGQGTFQWISPNTLQTLAAANQTAYQLVNGQYIPVAKGQQLPPGTALYQKLA